MMPNSQNCKRSTWLLHVSDNDCIIWILHQYRLNLTFKKPLYKKIDFLLSNSSLVVDLWVSPGMSLPEITNYHNFYLPSVYLSFSSDTHKVHINLSKCEAMCFYLLLQKIRIHSLNFLFTKIGFFVSTNV